MRKQVFFIKEASTANNILKSVYEAARERFKSGVVVITLSDETRTIEQNEKLWPMLTDLSKQVNYYGKLRSTAAWKDIATVMLQGENVEMVPDYDNTTMIAIGLSTSGMGKKKFSDLIECLYVIGSRYGVKWSEKSKFIFNEYDVINQRKNQ